MNRLLNIGFINVGHWTFNNNILRYYLTSHQATRNILYSFVSNGVIKYIGKTTMELTRRMYGYQTPGPSQTTNIRVNGKIKELLQTDQPVDIFILVDNGLLKYGDFKINLAAGLEDTLIYEISPEWNFSGKNKLEVEKESDSENLIIVNNPLEIKNQINKTFEVKLGKAYYNQGFFNVSQNHSENFGADKALIEIQLGDNSKNVIQGYINRTANKNGTPRIMGGITLSNWIKKNYKQDDILIVNILTNVSIKLNEKGKTTA
ncbi:GIY-YIG nuclease family protein [Runella sp. CRIBMP]|uniref:GIY-YIG nuclease family protein n=1 Tax=Runella sp. CRIBMP TaxID=2683261 RepID=UPI001411DBA0|nr:GIY-YIG nuclease family protein [Runella sp. CRIBMP]NBB22363.1 GIY-YIG nuclease family protein [Runella sp. CRIBMP]